MDRRWRHLLPLIALAVGGCHKLLALGSSGDGPLGDGAGAERRRQVDGADDRNRPADGPSITPPPDPSGVTVDGWGMRAPLIDGNLHIHAGADRHSFLQRDAWLVGDGGWMACNRGDGWRRVKSPTMSTLRSIWLPGTAGEGWAVGDGGAIVRLQVVSPLPVTSKLVVEPSPAKNDLRSIHSLPGVDPVVAGVGQVLMVRTANDWIAWPHSTSAGDFLVVRRLGTQVWYGTSLGQVYYCPPNVGCWSSGAPALGQVRALDGQLTEQWAGTENGHLLHRTGGTWSPPAQPASRIEDLLLGPTGERIWISGGSSLLVKDGASAPAKVETPGALSLHGLWRSGTDLFVTASGGDLYRCRNGQGPCYRIRLGNGPTYYGLYGVASVGGRELWLASNAGVCVELGWGCERLDETTPVTAKAIWANGKGQAWAAVDGVPTAKVVPYGREGKTSQGLVLATSTVFSITGWGDRPLWVGGLGGIFYKDPANGWGSALTLPNTAVDTIRSVWATGPSTGWAVGSQGRVYRNSGSGWKQRESLTSKTLFAVRALVDGDAWAVGDEATLLHYTDSGATKEPLPTECQQALRSIYLGTGGRKWVVGHAGLVCHFDGTSWRAQQTDVGVDDELHEIWGSSDTDLWVVGSGGTILHYKD